MEIDWGVTLSIAGGIWGVVQTISKALISKTYQDIDRKIDALNAENKMQEQADRELWRAVHDVQLMMKDRASREDLDEIRERIELRFDKMQENIINLIRKNTPPGGITRPQR